MEEVRNREDVPFTFVMADLPKPRESFVMVRGAYDKPGEKVSRAVPAFLPALPDVHEDRDYNRLDLANWLVNGEHPLTARVAVNRFWQQFFGTALSEPAATLDRRANRRATRNCSIGWRCTLSKTAGT